MLRSGRPVRPLCLVTLLLATGACTVPYGYDDGWAPGPTYSQAPPPVIVHRDDGWNRHHSDRGHRDQGHRDHGYRDDRRHDDRHRYARNGRCDDPRYETSNGGRADPGTDEYDCSRYGDGLRGKFTNRKGELGHNGVCDDPRYVTTTGRARPGSDDHDCSRTGDGLRGGQGRHRDRHRHHD